MRHLIFAIILFVFFESCSKSSISDNTISFYNQSGQSFNQIKNDTNVVQLFKKTAALGYQLDKIKLYNDLVLVDGSDMVLSKEQVESLYEDKIRNSTSIDLRQQIQSVVRCPAATSPKAPQTTNNIVYITFNVTSDLNDDWKMAIREAANAWNQTGGRVIFIESNAICTYPCTKTLAYGTPLAHIRTWAYQDPSTNVVAMANLPSSSGPGKNIYINTAYNSLSYSVKLNSIIHEMGHIIGYQHTDDATKGTHIAGTPLPGEDPSSVMNSFTHGWLGFSTGDLIAHRTLYQRIVTTSCQYGVL